MCLFVSIAIAPNSIVFLEKNNNYLLFPSPLPGALTYLSPSIFCNRFSSPSVLVLAGFGLFSLLVGCRLQAGRLVLPLFRFGGVRALLLVAFPRSSGWTMHEWRVVPCSNLDEVLPGSPEPGGKFFVSLFLSF